MKVEVIVDRVPGASDEDVADFVTDALSSWGGQFRPDDPLFRSLDVKRVRIKGVVYEPEAV